MDFTPSHLVALSSRWLFVVSILREKVADNRFDGDYVCSTRECRNESYLYGFARINNSDGEKERIILFLAFVCKFLPSLCPSDISTIIDIG